MYQFAVSISLLPGSAEPVRAILRDGPPFDLSTTSFERHLVFHLGDELIFVFEGQHAESQVAELLAEPNTAKALGRLAPYIASAPRMPDETFSWERPSPAYGLSFGPWPGPGNSDGGAIE